MPEKRYYIFLIISILIGVGLSSIFYSLDLQYSSEHQNPYQSDRDSYSRIICMSPSITEIVFELGLADNVIGVSGFCSYPPEATRKTNVGEYINPNLEKIFTLQPDLVIFQGKHDKLANFCISNSIPYFQIDFGKLNSILETISKLGEKLNRKHESDILIKKINDEFKNLDRQISNLEKARVLITLWRKPGSLSGIFTCGKGSFMNELLTIAGGENIFGDIESLYFEVSLESVSKRNPEVIIETLPGTDLTDKDKNEYISDWQSLSYIEAVKANRIYILTEDYLQIPGPRISLAADCFAKAIHPEVRFDE